VLIDKDKDGKEEVFLNPNTFSADGTTSLATVAFTEDALALFVSGHQFFVGVELTHRHELHVRW